MFCFPWVWGGGVVDFGKMTRVDRVLCKFSSVKHNPNPGFSGGANGYMYPSTYLVLYYSGGLSVAGQWEVEHE